MSPDRKPVVVVTGTSKGIGLAVTKLLLEKFNAIVVGIARSQTPAISSLLDVHSSSLLFIKADVTDEPAIRSAISQALSLYNNIDALILNAGVLQMGKIASPETTVDSWRRLFEVNFFSLLPIIQAAMPALKESKIGGRIIFVSSGAAVGAMPGAASYNASKAAMNSLCRSVAVEEPDLIAVAVRPGMVDTDMYLDIVRNGTPHVLPSHHNKVKGARDDGTLVRPEQSGYVIANLSIRAPKSMSGQYVSWDGEQCKEFRGDL